jgi:SAM-dependent methyltransferase
MSLLVSAVQKTTSFVDADVNFWFDKRCARAFWSQRELLPHRQLLADTTAWLDPTAGERWLDLGCGCGELTRALWEKSQGAVAGIVAIDCAAPNETAIAQMRASLVPPASEKRILFSRLDFSEGLAAFATGSVDGVVSGLAIQYAQHFSPEQGRWTTHAYDRLLAEVCRVLRPGGRFIFSVNVPNPAWLRIALHGVPAFFTSRQPLKFFRNSMRMLRYGKWLKSEAARGRFHYLPKETVLAKLAQAGFTRIQQRHSFARQAYLFRAVRPA